MSGRERDRPPLTMGRAWQVWARHRLLGPADPLDPCVIPVALRLEHFGPLADAARRMRELKTRMAGEQPDSDARRPYERKLHEAEADLYQALDALSELEAGYEDLKRERWTQIYARMGGVQPGDGSDPKG